ncbi:MAG: twin-arginine translocation signal domain-containing protein [Alphaproteobacteria bacterium]|nr:twin-arginine translocation signal domain-containing protein [Alphaproteobacteria bacterium]
MNRRKFVKQAGVGSAAVAAGTVAAPAIAQSMPEIKWRLTSSFPKSLDTLYGGAELFSKIIGEMSDNKFQVRVFASGEIVPGLQVADAVQNGTVEMGQTADYYYFGKDPCFVFGTGLPFSVNQRQLYAWLGHGGGSQLINEFYKSYGFTAYVFGGTGCQMGGWFRKEINSLEDMKGLKFRVGGFAGLILTNLGVVPQQIAGGDIYPALEKGTIDACEWVGPYDDEKLGFNKIAKYYYYPGWWEGCSGGSLYVNNKALETLPPTYKKMIESAAGLVTSWMVPKYDALNPAALKRLVAAGTVLKPFPRPVLEACFDASYKYYDELSAKNANFKKIYDSLKDFRADQNLWFRVAENTFDNFNFSMSARGR